jgi:hypothetical protein
MYRAGHTSTLLTDVTKVNLHGATVIPCSMVRLCRASTTPIALATSPIMISAYLGAGYDPRSHRGDDAGRGDLYWSYITPLWFSRFVFKLSTGDDVDPHLPLTTAKGRDRGWYCPDDDDTFRWGPFVSIAPGFERES